MNTRRKFIREFLKSLPPVAAYDLLNKFIVPEGYYNILVLLDIQRRPQQEAADMLGMSLETLKRHHRIALDMIDKSIDYIK